MTDIRVLPDDLVHKIAAGEVIERPASVVKELVENALDAHATHIFIAVENGGRTLTIADNGSGMTPDNLSKAFLNHATSKLPSEDVLFAIPSLGFRGEALASISAIAKVTCATRTADAVDGTRLTLQPGQPPLIQPTGCAPGTRMVVEDLFYTTPARLKFLKKPQTELAHITELVENLALSHPDVRFSLTVEGKSTLETPGNGHLSAVANLIFGETDWLTVSRQDDAMVVDGLISPPVIQKSSRRWIALFVNDRSVKCPTLTRAIEAAYEQILPPKRYPMAVIHVRLPYQHVDVNVHPSKREVRYADGQAVFGLVRAALQEALDSRGFWQQAGFLAGDNRPKPPTVYSSGPWLSSGGQTATPLAPPSLDRWVPPVTPATPTRETPGPDTTPYNASLPALAAEDKPPFRVIGQLHLTYMLVETRQGLMVVDQHIASERVLFEQLSRQLIDTPPDYVQPLLVPITRSLRPEQADKLQTLQPDLQKLGLAITITDAELHITGIPALLQERLQQGWVDDLLNRLDASSGPVALPIHDLVATLSCHAAVRAGDTLTHTEMTLLMAQWLACTLPWSCPHGRPIAHTIPSQDLNAFFDRPSLPAKARASAE